MATKIDGNWVQGIRNEIAVHKSNVDALISEVGRLEFICQTYEEVLLEIADFDSGDGVDAFKDVIDLAKKALKLGR